MAASAARGPPVVPACSTKADPLAFDDVLLAPGVPDLPHRDQHTDRNRGQDHGEHDGEDPAGMPDQQPGLGVGLCGLCHHPP